MKYKLIYITCKDQKEASKIGKVLVQEKLAACVNIVPKIKSIFRWQGKLVQNQESLLLVKTIDKKLVKLINKVKQMHSYKIPCIISFEIASGNKNFLKWIDSCLNK